MTEVLYHAVIISAIYREFLLRHSDFMTSELRFTGQMLNRDIFWDVQNRRFQPQF
jgi:hypothetical protein